MLDKRYLRDHAEEARAALAKRGIEFPPLVDQFLKNDEERRLAQASLDELRSQLNAASKGIGELLKAGQQEEAERAKAEVKVLKQRIAGIEADFSTFDEREQSLLLAIPNVAHESVPEGGEECAQLLREWGEPRTFDFEPLDHLELCQRLQLLNLEAGVRVTGSGFPVMHGQGALLQRALIQFMLDLHTRQNGYTELRPPFIVHPRCAVGTGNLPKFGEEMYGVTEPGSRVDPAELPAEFPYNFCLIPTAEMVVCNIYRDTILEAPTLPIKLCAYSPCWRVEAGHYGKEARGLTRVHQFEKVELVRIADPEQGWDDLEQMTREAEGVIECLGLAYRVKLLPSGDMTFGSAKTYDVEVHCPAEDAWREVSSASNTADYQSRRMGLRVRRAKGEKPIFPHLLNASGVALPRLVIAILETYQTERGTVEVPEVLRPYLHGTTELTPPEGGIPFV